MTVRYDSYINALQSGVIDLNNVSLSVIVVSKYYKPKATDTLQNVTSKIATFENILVSKELEDLEESEKFKDMQQDMSYIMDKVARYCRALKDSKNIELSEIAGFVTYTNNTLCFYEDLKINNNE